MAPAAVRFHPAAAQEAESAYDWYAARNPAVAHGFLEELRHAVAAVAENPRAWLRYGDRARRYVFLDSPSAWFTCYAVTTSTSSRWLTVGDGRILAVSTVTGHADVDERYQVMVHVQRRP